MDICIFYSIVNDLNKLILNACHSERSEESQDFSVALLIRNDNFLLSLTIKDFAVMGREEGTLYKIIGK